MSFGGRMKQARKNAGLTQRELADRMGFKHNAISNWEHGKSIPDVHIAELLCRHLGVTPNFLIWGENTPSLRQSEFTSGDWELLQKFRVIAPSSQAAVSALLDHFVHAESPVVSVSAPVPAISPAIEIDFVRGRISTQSVAAGLGTYLEEDSFEDILLERNRLTSRAAFYVPVSGNSMEPRYHDGDVLIVEDSPVQRGEVGIFTIDGLGYVKVLDSGRLLSLNPSYAPIPMNESIRCNGRVIGILEEAWIQE